MKTKEVLLKARKLIELPENWIKGTYARNKNDTAVGLESKSACKFCLSGALIRANIEGQTGTVGFNGGEAENTVRDISLVKMNCSHVHFNDRHRTEHKDVLALIDAAIAKCGDE